jgi:hypothetical protein
MPGKEDTAFVEVLFANAWFTSLKVKEAQCNVTNVSPES